MSEWEPQEVVIHPRRRWGPLVVIVLILVAAAAGLWYLRTRMSPKEMFPAAPPADHVRSDVSGVGDSLDVVVSWDLNKSSAAGLADSVRVEVGVEGTDPSVDLLPGRWRADTFRIAAPAPGNTSMGHSCVWVVRASRLSRESCTPWQFVRPAASETKPPPKREPHDTTPKKPKQTATSADSPQVLRLVIRPSGQQVDPDVAGKCAKWQQAHPDDSVWLQVNQTAVSDCMGPNGKPTVAQFCAFAVLQDGDRVKTENSTDSPYCEQLFQVWLRERFS